MIDAISNPSLFSNTGTTSSTRSTSLDADAFMKLLMTQLQHQDPMDPMDTEQMASQLAQFTTVEQLTKLNDTVTAQESTLKLNALLSQTSFSAALIGRQVSAQGDEVTIPANGPASVRIDVGTGGGKATLRLLDSSGNLVTTRDLGTLKAGRQTVTLPADLPAGNYHYEIKVTGSDDAAVSVTTYVSGTVKGVSFDNGDIVLHVGAFDVSIGDLAEVEPDTSTVPSS